LFEQLKQHSPSADITHKKALNQLAKTQLRNNIKRTIAEQNLNLSKLIQNLEKSMRNSILASVTVENNSNKRLLFFSFLFRSIKRDGYLIIAIYSNFQLFFPSYIKPQRQYRG
jgi:hypothetical protein